MVTYKHDFRTKDLAGSTAEALKSRGRTGVYVRKVRGKFVFKVKGKRINRSYAYRITYAY